MLQLLVYKNLGIRDKDTDMSNYNDTPVGSGYNTNSAINTELNAISTAIASKMDKAGTTMTGDLDLNSNDVLNVKSIGAQSMTLDGQLLTVGGVVTTTLPDQTGFSGEYLTTNGSTASWAKNSVMGHNVLDYGAVGNGTKDDTAAIQDACDAAGVMGLVLFPKVPVEYRVESTITVPLGQSWEGLTDWSATPTPTSGASRVRMWGATANIVTQAAQFTNMLFKGQMYNDGSTTAVQTCITSSGNLRLTGCGFNRFTVVLDVNGGFYHAFDKCTFAHNVTCVSFAEVNNVNFLHCKFSHFDYGITGTGGAGMLSLTGCSAESFKLRFINHLSGSTFAISIHQSYFENYPTTAVNPGLDTTRTGNYDEAIITTAGTSVSITDTQVSMKGIQYIMFGALSGALTAVGNKVGVYAAGVNVPTESLALYRPTGTASYMEVKETYQFIDSAVQTQPTAALAGITNPQIFYALSERPHSILDFDGNLQESGSRNNVQTGLEYTLTAGDFGKTIHMSHATLPTTLKLPSLYGGFYCWVSQQTAFPISFVDSGTLSLPPVTESGRTAATSSRYSKVKVHYTNTGSVSLSGELTRGVNVQTISYIVQNTDNRNLVVYNSGSAGNITVAAGQATGFTFQLIQQGAGAATLVASGTTFIGTVATATAGDTKIVTHIGGEVYTVGN